MDSLLSWDREVFFGINHGLSHPLLDPVMWLITSLGLGWVQLLVVLIASGWVARRRSAWGEGVKTVLLPAVIAFLGSGMAVQILKRLVPRLRPSNLPEAIIAPDERIFHNSFPSGHTATAFALAFWVFLITRRTRYRWWGYGALLLAALVGLSRIYRGVHYPSDVLAGALIGILWGAVACFSLNARRSPAPPVAESPPDSAWVSPRD